MKINVSSKEIFAFYALVAVSVIGLTYFVQSYPISGFDYFMTREIQAERGWNFTFLMKSISSFYDPVIGTLSVIMAALFFFLNRHRREAWFTLAVVFPDLFNLLLKILIHRARPTPEDAKIFLIFTQASFPSGHVVHYVVFFGFLIAVMVVNSYISVFWRIFVGIFSAFLILAVSISRIYLGAHWATDVLGGYLFGSIYLGIMLKFYLSGGGPKNPELLGQKAQ
jgi:membrane-associated phospholipid phosphatase